jgi:5-methylcytosine-specific restriction endonuclease McrA
MRIPRDKSLASWIRELEKEGKLYRFYKTEEWKELRRSILEEHHHECSWCKRKEPAVYTKAAHVHHVNEVKDRPELALSRTYRDAEGVKDNLVPLCMMCHNEAHGRVMRGRPKPQLNKERW